MSIAGIDTSKDLTRADAIRLWQDAKTAAVTAAGERDKAIERSVFLTGELKKLNSLLANEQELRKSAEGQISAADGRTKVAQEAIAKLENQLKQRRDCSAENKRLDQRVLDLRRRNDELTTQVASLKAHDFKADLDKARSDLGAEQIGRSNDGRQNLERAREAANTIAEQASEIAELSKQNKELEHLREQLPASKVMPGNIPDTAAPTPDAPVGTVSNEPSDGA